MWIAKRYNGSAELDDNLIPPPSAIVKVDVPRQDYQQQHIDSNSDERLIPCPSKERLVVYDDKDYNEDPAAVKDPGESNGSQYTSEELEEEEEQKEDQEDQDYFSTSSPA